MSARGLRSRGVWACGDPWSDLPDVPRSRLADVLSRWERTPYQDGQSKCMVAADCTGLLAGVLSDLYRVPVVLPKVPRDAGIHGRDVVSGVVLALRRQVPANLVRGGTVMAGDVVLTKAEFGDAGGRENHVGVASVRPGMVLHARSPRAVFSPLCAMPEIVAVYRLMEVHRWF